MLNILKKNWLIITFILISVVLPLLWLRGNYLYSGEETNFVNYQHVLEKNNYSWSNGTNYGEPAGHWNHSLIMPNGIFYYLLSSLGFSNPLIQKIFLSMIIMVLLLSISYFIRLFTNNKLLVAAGSLFYLLNFYTANSLFYSAKMYQLILLPLFFVFLYKYLKEKNVIYIFYNFLALFLLQAIFTNLPQLITTLLVYILTLIYFCLEERIGLRAFLHRYLLKIIYFLLPLIPICLYHLFVIYFSVMQNARELKSQTLSFVSLNSSIWQIIQLRGSWWSSKDYEGIAYNLWHSFYNNPIIVVISFLIISPVVLSIKKISEGLSYRFWLIVSLLFILLSSGFSFYPQIYNWMFEHLPYFYVFREPWAKFIPLVLFAFTALIVIALDHLRKNYLTWIILLLIIIRGFPFFSTNFFDHSNFGWKKLFVKIPEHWQQYNNWAKKNKNSYVLPLPFFINTTDRFIYQWNQNNIGNAGFPIYSFYSANSSINTSSYFVPLSNYNKMVAGFLSEDNYDFIRLGPIDYLLEQKDIDLGYKRTAKVVNKEEKEVLPYFEKYPSQNFSDKLALYRSKPEYFMPKIYLADNIILTDNPVKNLPTITSSVDFDQASVVYAQDNFADIGKDDFQANISRYTVGYSDKNQLISDTVTQLNKLYSAISGWQNTKEINNGFLAKLDQQELNYQLRLLDEAEKKYQEIKDINFIYKIDNKPVGNLKNVSTELVLSGKTNEQNQPKKDSINIELNGQKETFEIISSNKNNNVILKNPPLTLDQNKISSDGNKLSGVIIKDILQQVKPASSPRIDYKKINPTKYEVNIIGIKDKMPLIFNEDYHNGWKLYLGNNNFYSTWFKKSVAGDTHLMANGYANSWLINPQTLCNQVKSNKCIKNQDGTYDLTFMVVYWPQRVFVLVATMMILTLLVILILVLLNRRRIKSLHQSWV